MAFTFNIPRQLIPGDTRIWKDSFSGYSPTRFSLTWAIRGNAALDLTAVAAGDEFQTTLTATQSNTLAAGVYFWQAMITEIATGGRLTLGQGQLEVFTNLAGLPVGGTVDNRSAVQKMFEAVEAAILARLQGTPIDEYSIQGRSIKYMNLFQLREMRDQLKVQLMREQAASGEGPDNRRIYIQFKRPQ